MTDDVGRESDDDGSERRRRASVQYAAETGRSHLPTFNLTIPLAKLLQVLPSYENSLIFGQGCA